MKKYLPWCVLALGLGLSTARAGADLYSATAAADKQDFARAFDLYRELAEIGLQAAQENLAVMYVNGEGVKRDNVLGYAWATIALEGGPSEAAKSIVDQLAPHLSDSARTRVAELRAQFGHEALQKSLLPVQVKPSPWPPSECNPVSVGDPYNFYPTALRTQGVAGDVMVEMTVFGDGHVHDPRVIRAYPPEVFSAAGRNVVLHNRHKAQVVNGTAVPCVVRIKVRFTTGGADRTTIAKETVDGMREKAKGGDPMAQLTYAYVIETLVGFMAKDFESPIPWYLKAAQAGIPAAQYFVGMNALAGNPLVEKDEAKGILWLNKAASGGSPEAHIALANYQLRKSPDPVALAAAIDHFGKAVEGGNPDAAYYLAALLATGPDASLRNSARALELIEKAKDGFGENPIWWEIRAAAHAVAGDFEKAQKDQTVAVRTANNLGWNTAPQKARLADYKAGKSWSGDLFAFY